MKIDYFNDFQLRLEGAESIHVYEICRSFQGLGHEVRLISPATKLAGKIPFGTAFIPTPSLFTSIFFQIFGIFYVTWLWRHSRPDIIYARVSPVLLLPAVLSRLYRIPLYAEINGTIYPELKKANTKLGKILVRLKISDFVESATYHTALRVITVTPTLKTFISDRFKIPDIKIFVVENGVNAQEFYPMRLPRATKDITVGYVGGLMWWQGLEYVVKAVAKIDNPAVKLVIYGDGPERIALNTVADLSGLGSRVRFAGKIAHDDVADAINHCDICVAYYVKARSGLNSPFKVYEYLSCGIATVVSDIKGIGDVFADVAAVAPAEDSDALAAAILNLCNNPDARNRLAETGRNYILKGHTWDRTAEKIIALIGDRRA